MKFLVRPCLWLALLMPLPLRAASGAAAPGGAASGGAASGGAASGDLKTKPYADPDGAFALQVPEKWKIQRSAVGGIGMLTEFSAGGQEDPQFSIAVFASATELEPSVLDTLGPILIQTIVDSLKEAGSVIASEPRNVRLGTRAAIRSDLTFRRGPDGVPQRGWTLVTLGRKNSFLLALSAPQADPAALAQLESVAGSLALESRQPGTLGQIKIGGAAGMLNAGTLAQLAQKVKAHQREAPGTVLVAGDPPLTYGSIAAFARLMSRLFDVELTETEFDIMRQQISDAYRRSDAEGDAESKKLMALGWQALLDDLAQGTPQEQAAKKQQLHDLFAARFAAGAQAGLGWAKAIHDAMGRRSQALKTVAAPRPAFAPKDGFDNEFSEADLDSALEMLYFMWIAAGRDAHPVAPTAVATVRAALLQNFAGFPPQLQWVLANAPKVYAAQRAAWFNANEAARLQMARGFAADLDALGLTVPRQGGDGGGAWADWEGKTHGEFAAEMVQGLAGSSSKSAW